MRIAYLDCFSGMSGDMFLGALIDAGVPARLFEVTVAALEIGARLDISRVSRSGISATKVDVFVNGEKELPREVFWEQQEHQQEQGHAHSHTRDSHEHKRGHGVEDGHAGEHDQAEKYSHAHVEVKHERHHVHGRGLSEIRKIIADAAISNGAKKTATAIFQALGEAEARVHNSPIESIHFHEVGAVDAMVDIVCAAVGAEAVGVDEWVCSPLNVGSGTIKCAHGMLPVPAPATIELLKGAPVYSSGLTVELVTPTGAAIVKTLARRFGEFPAMKVEKTGYGAGTRDFPNHANVVRITVGEAQEGEGRSRLAMSAPHEIAVSHALHSPQEITGGSQFATGCEEETITVLEANIDDLNPQIFGYVMDRLLQAGALDVFGVPVQMKKNRPGMLLTALCRVEDAASLSSIIFAETTTLGVRRREEKRQVLGRKWVAVHTKWGEVRVKVASRDNAVTNYAPEYEDCCRIAGATGVPLKEVMQEAMRVYAGNREGAVEKAKDKIG